ncbi:Putative peptidoglycan binding domain-containing protein [Rhodospirillales bacterium URHD0017]|nr:Putative peptidoglycan binding domain-containing protein [Rhodospirillales bacterium URHD0017]
MSDEASQTQSTAPVDLVSLAPGRMIGRYEVVSVLGQGGFGITYRARDAQLGREVAVKEYLPLALAVRQHGTTVLPRSTTAAQDFAWGRDRFVAEGRTLASLQNAPGIVRVFDFLEANGTAYIVMQLVQGETLENRLKAGPLAPAAIERVLWPLLDGLEQVHHAGFLHRDIKPANILLDATGHPTLIDFGASRAAMLGRTSAMTAIFTPGYAAGEQMTSARQGPWTDIYGLSATLYHAITGAAPPSAFDRMLDDEYQPLARMAPPGFGRGLLVGLDAGLAVRASDRPQSIAGWRPILSQAAAPDAAVTVAIAQSPPTLQPSVQATVVPPPVAAAPAKKSGVGIWIGGAVAAILLLAGGYYALVDGKRAPQTAASVDKAAQDAQLAAEAQRLKDQEELARLRAENEQRQKAEQEAAQRKQADEEARRKADAEAADRKRQEDEARQNDEAAKKTAEAGESGLRLTVLDRQHAQIALNALGFATGSTNGSFGSRTREAIATWQKSRNELTTGYLTGTQNQALLRDAAPAIARFDEEQKKLEEARRKAEEDRVKAEAAARPPAPAATPAPPPPAPVAPAPAAPSVAAATPRAGPDGHWSGTYHCSPSRAGGAEFNARVQITLSGGAGTWIRPGTESGTMVGNQSFSIKVTGSQVVVSRVYTPGNRVGVFQTATMTARFDGNGITGSGPEHNSGGRTCDISLTRAQ